MKEFRLLISIVVLLLSQIHAVEVTSFANKCYQCLSNNNATLNSTYYCGGLNKCYTSVTDLSKNCTYNATDQMSCPINFKCQKTTWNPISGLQNTTNSSSSVSGTTQNADYIIIDSPTQYTLFNSSYSVPPNQRCQFFIANTLIDESSNSSFAVVQDMKAFNITANTTITNSSNIHKLRMYLGNSIDQNTLLLQNKSSQLQNYSQGQNTSMGNGNYTYIVVINDSPDSSLSFTVMYGEGVVFRSLLCIISFMIILTLIMCKEIYVYQPCLIM